MSAHENLTVRQSRLRVGLGAFALCALVLIIYHPILPGSFLMDDERLVRLDNPILSGKLGPLSIWFQADFPLSNVVWWVEWLAWGNNPAGYHAVNILLHALSAVLLWRLLARLRVPGAWVAGAVFTVHPVCVASVGRIAELKNTLSLPFFLLSFWAYLRYEANSLYVNPGEQDARHRAWTWYGLSLGGFVLAFLSKSTTLVLPLMLLGCAAWQRRRITRRDLLHTSPHFALALGYGLMAMWFQKYQALAGETLEPHSVWERLAAAGRVFWFYLGKAILPLNLNLVYPRWHTDATAPTVYLPLLLLVAAGAVCWAFRRTWGRHALFGLGCFGAALLPALGFFDAQFLTKWQVSDHLQYLALAAPVAMIGAAVAMLPRAAVFRGFAAASLLGLSALTFQRARVFAAEESLLRDTLAKNPAAWAAHNDLGCILATRKDHAGAFEHFAASIRANPGFADAHLNLGQALALQAKWPEAEAHYLTVLKLHPTHAEAHKRLATALASQHRVREALPHLQRALSLSPDPQTRLDLAAALYQSGELRRAAEQLRRVVALEPQWPVALNNLAWLLATCSDEGVRDGKEAVRCAERACRLTAFKQTKMVGTLAASYAEAGRFPEAVATAETAVRMGTASGETRFAVLNEQLARLYRENKPWHEHQGPQQPLP